MPLTDGWFRAEEDRMREAAEAEVEQRKSEQQVALGDSSEWDPFIH